MPTVLFRKEVPNSVIQGDPGAISLRSLASENYSSTYEILSFVISLH